MKILATITTLLTLGTLVACGGGGGNASTNSSSSSLASGLTYTNPTSGTYRLVKSTAIASTGTHLVLDLVGPSAGTGSGVSVTITAGSQVAWTNVNGGDAAGTYISNGAAFDLGTKMPQLIKAQVMPSTNTLVATVAEKGIAAKPLNVPLLRVALDFKGSLGTTTGTTVVLSPGACKLLDNTGNTPTITVTSGTLTAQ